LTQNSTNPLQRFSRAVGQILTPKTPSLDTQEQSQPSASENVPNNPTPVANAPLTKERHSRPTTPQEDHPTLAYPPIHETFFDNKPPQVPLASPDALTSSSRTDFTYSPIETLQERSLVCQDCKPLETQLPN
jgi:hypothetical protein